MPAVASYCPSRSLQPADPRNIVYYTSPFQESQRNSCPPKKSASTPLIVQAHETINISSAAPPRNCVKIIQHVYTRWLDAQGILLPWFLNEAKPLIAEIVETRQSYEWMSEWMNEMTWMNATRRWVYVRSWWWWFGWGSCSARLLQSGGRARELTPYYTCVFLFCTARSD